MTADNPRWKPKPEEFLEVLQEQNPWHRDGKVPDTLAFKHERPLVGHIVRRLKSGRLRRYQLILGPRRVGKTTTLFQAVRRLLKEGIAPGRIWYMRLDHPLLMPIPLDTLIRDVIRQSRAKPEDPAYLFLDELVYARDWDLWLKTFYDERLPIRVAASSSATAALKDRAVESGVGRWEEQYLAPYHFSEYIGLAGHTITLTAGDTLAATLKSNVESPPPFGDLEPWRRRLLLTGGFPELLPRDPPQGGDESALFLESQRILRSDAVERAIYKDIPQAFGIENPMLLERMLYVLAGQVAGILSPNNLSQTLHGLSSPTFDRYLSYMIQAFLVFTLPNYSGNEEARQKRGRKLYFVDGAVRNAALQRGVAPLKDPTEMGLLLENVVASHLHTLSALSQARLFHWRDKNSEVDLIYEDLRAPVIFEIGMSPSHSRKGLVEFMTRYPKFRGSGYLVAPEIAPSPPSANFDGIGSIPLDLLLLAIGAQAEKDLLERLGG